jgi:hypothetical protein
MVALAPLRRGLCVLHPIFFAAYCIQHPGKSFTEAVINLYKRLREESGGKLSTM